jgi:hypothetical protein
MKTVVALGGEGIGVVYADGKHFTRDQGGTATTPELCRAVLDALR